MNALQPTRLEQWQAYRLKCRNSSLNRLDDYQLAQLNRTLDRVLEKSPFYGRRLKEGPRRPLSDLAQMAELPFTTAEDVRRCHLDMLCVSHGEVARVVTLQTSGTTSAPKRLYFNEADLELTIDFFQHGMACLVQPGQQVLILLPGPTPDSVGDLLQRGLARIPATGHLFWPVLDLDALVEKVRALNIACLVGAPAQIFALCRHEGGHRFKPGMLKSVLLSTDYVPTAVVTEIEKIWGCRVFEHYGMTEMGFGGGLHCDVHRGYHLREIDLLFEIIHPETGQPLPPGKTGEVVFTTLTRQAMPLIRYRTGDEASWLEGPCGCGSVLRRMSKVRGRCNASFLDAAPLSIADLDEALLGLPGLYSFQAGYRTEADKTVLNLTLFCRNKEATRLKQEAADEISRLSAERSIPISRTEIDTQPPRELRWDATGMVKRNFLSL